MESQLLVIVGLLAVVSTVGLFVTLTALMRQRKRDAGATVRPPERKNEGSRKKKSPGVNAGAGADGGFAVTSDAAGVVKAEGKLSWSDDPKPGADPASVMERGLLVSGFDSQGTRVKLTIPKRDLERSRWGVTIGRDRTLADYEVRDADKRVSRRHFRLMWNAGHARYEIEDLGSGSGTHVVTTSGGQENDHKLNAFQVEQIQIPSEIRIGRLKLDLSLS